MNTFVRMPYPAPFCMDHTYRSTHVLWMDIWSLAEILECRAELFSEMTAKEATTRFTSFGGSVRLVLANHQYKYAYIERCVTHVDAEQLLQLHLEGLSGGVSDALVHIRVRWLTLVLHCAIHCIDCKIHSIDCKIHSDTCWWQCHAG